MKAYMDDIVVKSKKVKGHITDLNEVFKVLKKYKIKLKAEKCVFRISIRKFLGFMAF